MWGLLRKVWRDLGKRPWRTALTVLGIAVGVAGVVAILSTARNLVRAQRELYASSSQADLTYWIWNAPASILSRITADERVSAAELRLTYTTRWRHGDTWRDVELVGIADFGAVRLNQFTLVSGSAPGPGEILLDVSASAGLGAQVGSEVFYRDALGRERPLRVSGLSRSPSYLSSQVTQMDVAYVPASVIQRQLDIPGFNQLLVQVPRTQDVQAVTQRISRLVQRQGLQIGAPDVRRPDQFPGRRELDALIVLMGLFSALGLVLSGLLVANTLAASVSEQADEIGILKTLGARRRQVLWLYLLESLAYGSLGTLLGIGLGTLLGWRLLDWIGSLGNAEVHFRLAPEGIGLGMLIGLGVAVVAGLTPALRAAGLSVQQVLASYGIQSEYGRGRLARLLGGLAGLPLSIMAIRNLARRPGRSASTLLVIALASGSFLGAWSTQRSVNTAITDIYATYDADAWVWLNDSVTPQFEASFTTLDGVYAAEGWALADGVVGLAEARLWGLPAETILYRHVLREGRWYTAAEPDAIVLSAELADANGWCPGDVVEVQVHARSRVLHVVGIAVDNTIFLGGTLAGKAFLPRATLNQLLDQEDRVSLFALGLTTDSPVDVEAVARQIEAKFVRWHPSVQPVYAEIAAAREASRLLSLGLVAMVVLVALVGSLGVVNTITLNVLERRQEIAVLRALGAGSRAVSLVFITEGVTLASLGWLLGLGLGLPLGWVFTRQLSRVLFTLPYRWVPAMLPVSLLFALVIALGASLGPALGAARVRPAAALRYE